MDWVLLEELCTVSQGAPISRLRSESGKEFQIIQISNLGTLELGGDLEVERLPEHRTPTVKPGEVLISLRGSPIRAAVVPEGVQGCVASPNIAVLTLKSPGIFTKDTSLDPYYLAGLFSSEYMNRILSSHMSGGAVPSLSVRTLRGLKVPVPEPRLQQDFAEAFKAHNRASVNAAILLALQRKRLEVELGHHLGESHG